MQIFRPTSSINVSPFRILVSSFVNLNVVDGSSFFLAGLARMCAEQAAVEVTLVSPHSIENFDVVDEVLRLPNVTIVEPQDHPRERNSSDQRVTRSSAALQISQVLESSDFDAILIRDTELACELFALTPSAAEQTSVYLTGITTTDSSPDTILTDQIDSLFSSPANFFVQTPEMKEEVLKKFDVSEHRLEILPPHVPQPKVRTNPITISRSEPFKFIYSGKFFPGWNTDRILAGFKASNARSESPMHLTVLGDQFRNSQEFPKFEEINKYLLTSTKDVSWFGRVPRRDSRRLISQSDVGISWRRASLDSSTEFSTKVIEYGAAGLPVILNRTPMHERKLGIDYPLFCNSMADFKELLATVPIRQDDLFEAAKRSFIASEPHWHSNVFPKMLRHLSRGKLQGQRVEALQINDLGLTPNKDSKRFNATICAGLLLLTESPKGLPRQLLEIQAADYSNFWASLIEYESEKSPLLNNDSLEQSAEGHHEIKQELAATKNQLRAIKNSRIGRLQQTLWKLRKKL